MLKEKETEKIERYAKGLSDRSEEDYVESLFTNGENNCDLKSYLSNDWNSLVVDESTSERNLDHILDKVHHIIRKDETLKSQKPIRRIIRIYMKIAAIMLLPLLIAGGFAFNHIMLNKTSADIQLASSTIYAPLGARVKFMLPDGTSGMLNSGSELSYSVPFDNIRKVRLDGEAWFEVTHDEAHPFEINTGKSIVKVLGTNLNVSSYSSENYIEVVLQKGKVEFSADASDEAVTLLPSERLIFQNGKLKKSVTDPEKYIAWTEGKLVFRGDQMDEVCRRIERWYNVKIELTDLRLMKYSFRATFEDDNLEDVLKFLSMTSPINYKIVQRAQLKNGTYEKEKVTININK